MKNIPMQDNTIDYKISLNKLVRGINKVRDILKPTYGPNGGNILIQEPLYPFHAVRNDGKLITDKIHFSDPIEEMGANILREACDKQEKEAGDGRKTTTILTAAILNEGLKYTKKYPPLLIKRQLDECLPLLTAEIEKYKRPITVKDIEAIATSASESPEVGKVIAQAYEAVGVDGGLEIEAYKLPGAIYEVMQGYRIRKGWLGGYWQTEEGKCVLQNPHILISKEKITSVDDLLPLYEALAQKGIRELVIYCEEIDRAVANRIALTSLKGSFHTLIIEAPILWKDWLYEDIALLTGATPLDITQGKTFKSLALEDLGTCEKLIATEDEVRLLGTKNIDDHIAKLKELGKEDDQLLVRASLLKTQVAVVRVGTNSESETTWLIRKARDGISAAYAALQEGVVPAMGTSYRHTKLPNTIGGKILKVALQAPYNCLLENKVYPNINEPLTEDPAIVVKSAIKNAISIAGIILTSKGALNLHIPKEGIDPFKR